MGCMGASDGARASQSDFSIPKRSIYLQTCETDAPFDCGFTRPAFRTNVGVGGGVNPTSVQVLLSFREEVGGLFGIIQDRLQCIRSRFLGGGGGATRRSLNWRGSA